MQLRSLTFAAAAIVSVVFTPAAQAGNCSDSQMQEIDKIDDDEAFHKACPTNDDGSFDVESTDPKVWAKISPCKDAGCAKFLNQQASKVPDCDSDGVNMKKFYKDELDLCLDLASGKLTSDEIKQRLAAATGDMSGSFGDWLENDNVERLSSVAYTTVAPVKNTTATATTPTTNTNAPSKTPAPRTKKSSASSLVISGGVVAITSLVVSLTAV